MYLVVLAAAAVAGHSVEPQVFLRYMVIRCQGPESVAEKMLVTVAYGALPRAEVRYIGASRGIIISKVISCTSRTLLAHLRKILLPADIGTWENSREIPTVHGGAI